MSNQSPSYDIGSPLGEPNSWQERSACRHAPPGLFFPIPPQGRQPGRGDYEAQVARCKAICARCPVREQCLAYALDYRMPDGIWGGLTEDERLAFRRGRRRGRVA